MSKTRSYVTIWCVRVLEDYLNWLIKIDPTLRGGISMLGQKFEMTLFIKKRLIQMTQMDKWKIFSNYKSIYSKRIGDTKKVASAKIRDQHLL